MKSLESNPPRVLIADDQADVREALRLLLKGEGFKPETVNSPAEVLAAVEQGEFDAVLIDLNYARDTTSGQEGLDLLAGIPALDSTLPVVVMTAWANVELAVEAMRRGARDFVQKPWDNARLLATLRTQVELSRALRRGRPAGGRERAAARSPGPTLIAESPAMRPVLEIIERIGPSEANVLITGENGTGKGVVARAIHAVSRASGQAAGRGQHGGPVRRRVRERDVRSRERGFHGRQDGSGGPVRAGGWRHALSRRDRQHPAEPAGQAAAGAGDGRIRARRLLAHPPGQRAADFGHQRKPGGGTREPAGFAATCCSG